MNLIIIGNDTDNIALDIWKGNTNYTVLNQSPYVWSNDFKKFIKDRPVIVSTTSEQFVEKNINDVIEFMIKNEFIPILIADNKKAIENNIYTALSDSILSSLLYIKNKENKDYDELIKRTQGYLLGKGIIENGNKTLRTPRKRKKSATEK